MASSADKEMGVPIKLFHEGSGHTVTVELKNGEMYKGLLADTEDTMNCTLKDVMMTMRNGQVKMLESVYLRGGNVKFVILPDTLKSVPILSKVREAAARKAEAAAGREPAGRGRGGRGSGRGGSSVGEKRGR